MKVKGYIALLTVIIVTVVLSTLGALMTYRAYRLRGDELIGRFKVQSRSAAEGCLEHALLALSLNNTYGGNETVTITQSPIQTCQVGQVSISGATTIIRASAVVNDATTNLVLTVTSNTLARVSLQEVRNF